MDWKEALLASSKAMGIDPSALPTEDAQAAPVATSTAENFSDKLRIFIERKGRAGKCATIITGFSCSEEQLQSVAATLKQTLGTGGSARGGEILIQGDRRTQVCEKLRAMGYRDVK